MRNIILPVARQNLTGEPATEFEAQALAHNEALKSKPLKQFF